MRLEEGLESRAGVETGPKVGVKVKESPAYNLSTSKGGGRARRSGSGGRGQMEQIEVFEREEVVGKV
jgi:hypothetical protein